MKFFRWNQIQEKQKIRYNYTNQTSKVRNKNERKTIHRICGQNSLDTRKTETDLICESKSMLNIL